MPERRTFRARWSVTTLSSPRIAVTHRHDRHTRSVIENVRRYPHPVSQSLAARIVPRNSSGVHSRTRSLSYYKNARRLACLEHRPRAEWKKCVTRSAVADCDQQIVERAGLDHGGSAVSPAILARSECGGDANSRVCKINVDPRRDVVFSRTNAVRVFVRGHSRY